ncbi:hypothetical protein HDU76_012950 [Blyttiomyces sp. JEL0837]|nr:hypothetical protein HDU76_012950 [Blyttiomyces sp. JEL0837]
MKLRLSIAADMDKHYAELVVLKERQVETDKGTRGGSEPQTQTTQTKQAEHDGLEDLDQVTQKHDEALTILHERAPTPPPISTPPASMVPTNTTSQNSVLDAVPEIVCKDSNFAVAVKQSTQLENAPSTPKIIHARSDSQKEMVKSSYIRRKCLWYFSKSSRRIALTRSN